MSADRCLLGSRALWHICKLHPVSSQVSGEVTAGPMQCQCSCAGSAARGLLDVQAGTWTGSFLFLMTLKFLLENVDILSGIERTA